MFPTDITFPETKNIENQNDNLDVKVGRSFVFDYVNGQHVIVDGKPKETTEAQAIQQWLELLVRTVIGKYTVYQDTKFGTTWEKYISYRQLPNGYIQSELEREIQESCNEYCPAIERVQDFTAERLRDGLIVSFTAELKNKQVLEVRVNV